MDLELVVLEGQQPGLSFRLTRGDRRTLGRAPECEIRLSDQGVSRRHCTVEHAGHRLIIVDLDSANGSFINTEPVQEGTLQPGDRLAVGPVVLECRPLMRPPRPGEATLAFRESGSTTVVRKVVETHFPALHDAIPSKPDDIEDLRRAQRNLAAAYHVSKMLAQVRHLEGIFDSIIESIFDALNADRAALLLSNGDDAGGELNVVAARSRSPDGALGEISVSRTVVQDVLENHASSLSRDATTDERYRQGQSIIQQKIQSVMCAPVATDQEVLGVLYADSRSQTGAFSENDLDLLALIGNVAGVAIHRAQVMAQEEQFFFDTIRAFVASIDAKDGYTHRHSERVAAFASRIARELGVSAEEIEVVKLAALLHDVGKIGVSESILNKPGRLTNDEFSEMRKHPLYGLKILSHIRSPRFRRILPGVRSHHEKWDGTGYPDAAAGDGIPLIGRILAVADFLDALTSERSYRGALEFDEVVGMIEQEAGKHFDPRVAAAAAALHSRGQLEVPAEWIVEPADIDPTTTLET